MAQPYVGEIRIFAGNFAPAGWAMCDGQLLPISEYETLWNLIGTTYGGDGQATFALPDLRGRLPIHQGQGPGLPSNRILAENGGVESVTVTVQQLPIHTHPLMASADVAGSPNPGTNVLAETVTTTPYFADTPATALSSQAATAAGGGQPHENLQPYLCVNFIISQFGIFPSQT